MIPLKYVAGPDGRFTECHGKKVWIINAWSMDKLMGVCSVVTWPDFGRITALYVTPSARLQGVGSGLIRYAVESVVGPKDVYIEADSFDPSQDFEGFNRTNDNPPMNDKDLYALYVKLGFEPIPGHPFSLVKRPKRTESYA